MQNREYEKLQERKSHSDVFFPYNTYLCTIPLDFVRVPPHWHDDVEFIVIKSGRGIVSVDTVSYYVKAEEMIIVRPGQIHAIYQEENHTMEYENIIFKTNLLYTASSDLCTFEFFESYFRLKYEAPVHICSSVENGALMRECIEKIDTCCIEIPSGYQIMIKSYLYQFFSLLMQTQKGSVVQEHSKRLEKIKRVICYVEEHYTGAITVASVSKEVGFSDSHFMKFFKQNMHITFTCYLNDYRLNKASERLLATEDTVVAIMESVGFNNLSYFNRLFKAYFQMTPREYRKQYIPDCNFPSR